MASICWIGLFAMVEPASAATNGAWSVFPAASGGAPTRTNVQARLVAGQPYHDTVSISNFTAQPLTFDLYAADALTTSAGGFAIHRMTDPKQDIGGWIRLPTNRLTVQPQTKVDVPFSIEVPADARSGDHAAGIVAQNTQATTSRAGAVQLNQLDAVGVRVYGRVIGALTPALKISHLSVRVKPGIAGELGGPVRAALTFSIKNTGNELLTPKTFVDVSPFIGSGQGPDEIDLGEVIPGGEVTLTKEVSILPVGMLRAHVRATAGHVETGRSKRVLVIPWLLVGLLAFGVIAVVASHRFRSPGKSPMSIAGAHGGKPLPT